MNDIISGIIGACVMTILFIARDAHRGWQERRTISHKRNLDRDDGSLTPPQPITDEKSLTQDHWDRLHSRLVGLRDNMSKGMHIESRYVVDFHSILDQVAELGFSVDKFRIQEDHLESHHFVGQNPDRYSTRPEYMSKLEAFIHYLELKRPS